MNVLCLAKTFQILWNFSRYFRPVTIHGLCLNVLFHEIHHWNLRHWGTHPCEDIFVSSNMADLYAFTICLWCIFLIHHGTWGYWGTHPCGEQNWSSKRCKSCYHKLFAFSRLIMAELRDNWSCNLRHLWETNMCDSRWLTCYYRYSVIYHFVCG